MQTLNWKHREAGYFKQHSSSGLYHVLEAKSSVSASLALHWTRDWTIRKLIIWKLGYVFKTVEVKFSKLLLAAKEKMVSFKHHIRKTLQWTWHAISISDGLLKRSAIGTWGSGRNLYYSSTCDYSCEPSETIGWFLKIYLISNRREKKEQKNREKKKDKKGM